MGPAVTYSVDSTGASIFVVTLVELTNTVFVNSTNITTNIDAAVLSNTVQHLSFSTLDNSIFLYTQDAFLISQKYVVRF